MNNFIKSYYVFFRKPLFFLVTFFLIVIFFMIKEHNESKPESYRSIPVSYSVFKQEVLVSGKLEAKEKVDIGAQVSGQLKSINTEIGETVSKGQLLAVIDSAQAENEIKAQDATLTALFAQRNQVLAKLKESKTNFNRQRQLVKTQSISQQEFDSALTEVIMEQEQAKAVNAQIENQKAVYAAAKTGLSYTRIVSPIDGQITSIEAAEGQTLVATQQAPIIMTVSNLDTMLVRLQASEADIIHLKTGMKAWFTVLGDEKNRHEGVLKTILPTPETVNNATFYDVLFEVPNHDGILRLGMTAQIHIELKEDRNVLTVPLSALGEKVSDQTYSIKLLQGSKAIQTNVTIGARNDTCAEVIRGVRAGDQVILDPLSDKRGE